MHFLYNKKTFLGLVGLLMVVGLMAYSGKTNKVVAEGGNKIYAPAIAGSDLALSTQAVVFGANSTWKYFDKGSVPGTGWNQPAFVDTNWAAGSAPLGYDTDGGVAFRTVVSYGPNAAHKYITTYFRKTFSITNPATLTGVSIDLQYDDGAVVYLNGKEITRKGMPSGTPAYSTYATSCLVGASSVNIPLAASSFVAGNNTLAVEVHQCTASSTDIVFGLTLNGTVSTAVPLPTATATALKPTATIAATATLAAPTPTSLIPASIPTATSAAVQPTPTTVATKAPTPVPTAQPTVPPTTGRSYYVATTGSSGGDGSLSRPWNLQTAFNQPSSVLPGDTIWVRGGTYSGVFTCSLKGPTTAPITVRAYPGERATISNSNDVVMDIYNSAYVNFWGLEIAGSETSRNSATYPTTFGVRVNQGAGSTQVKFINMIVHDVQSMGFGWWQALTNSEIYGSLVYFNGTTKLDHGIYVHNVSGTKLIANNFIFDNASHGIHGYAETADKGLTNINVDGNTLFNNGSLIGTYKRNILMGGLTTTYNSVISNNYAYYPDTTGESLNLGYTAGSSGAQVINNYLAGGAFEIGGGATNLTMSGNNVYAPGGLLGFSSASFSNNTWTTTKPSGVKVFVRPNKYETYRANVTIFNWNRQSTVSVAASSLTGITLKAGDHYELHNVQNYYGDVITGVYDGAAIVVPMTGRSVAQPVGLSGKPASSFPEFGGFVLIVNGY